MKSFTGNSRSKKGSKTFSKKAVKKAHMFEKYVEQFYSKNNSSSDDDYNYSKDPSFTRYRYLKPTISG